MSNVPDSVEKPSADKEAATNPTLEVHSANSWETADLGDQDRNQKFLRLMGAGKKEHRGKIVIGDHKPVHKREKKEEQHLTEELTEQYEHSLEYRLAAGRRGHLGLGFHPDSAKKDDEAPGPGGENDEEGVVAGTEAEEGEKGKGMTEESAKESEQNDSPSKSDGKNKSREKDERKRESSDKNEEDSGSKKLKFVKGSP